MSRPLIPATILSLAAASSLLAADAPTTRLPETTSTGFSSALSEETPIGVTQRPEWTSARRFPNTRVYIQKEPWEVGVETWWRIKHHRDGTLSHRLLEEVEIGLPGRMQLDLYQDIEGDERGKFHAHSFNVELRWALADWGKIWGNPTIYGEYKFVDDHWGADVYEFKLLLGDQIASRWHWGVNFVWEAEIGGEREQEFQITGGLSYTLVDGKIGIGIEALYDRDTVRHHRGEPDDIFAIGPSVQFRLTKNLHVDFNCMFGANNVTDRQIGYLVVGYDFGPGGHNERSYSPISGQRN